MKITVFGSGYVGLVTGTCFAQVGNFVTCVDIDAERVQRLQGGECLIHEPGLEPLMRENVASGRLIFTSDATQAMASDVVFIAVGTPAREDGSADLTFVESVASTLGDCLDGPVLVVDKSTVPVGTADKVKKIINDRLQARGLSFAVDVASNPEFLKEGHAVNDFMKPDRVVVGVSCVTSSNVLRELYAPFNRNHDKLIVMDVLSAELTKYVANAMLATKISFMNEMSCLADRVGADIELVRQGIGSDQRIGYQFIYPGCGYGGSCFPKDVQALVYTAEQAGMNASLIRATHAVNEQQKSVLFDKMSVYFDHDLQGKRFAVWGLAFKPNTDDVREAPSLLLIEQLLARGAAVCAYDSKASSNVQQYFGDVPGLCFADSAYAATDDADALIIMTEWMEFRSPDFELLRDQLNCAVIFDGRNLFAPKVVAGHGLDYVCIGRPMAKRVAVESCV